MNQIKTFMLLAAMTALFVGVGYMIGGPTGMAMALAFALVGNLISYWNADKIVLSMYKAQEVPPNHPDARVRAYASDVREMAQRAGMPMPKITIPVPASMRVTARIMISTFAMDSALTNVTGSEGAPCDRACPGRVSGWWCLM